MNRYFKWTSIAFLIIIVLVVGGSVAVRVFFSPEQVKNLATSYGSEFLGRKIKLEHVSLGLFVSEVSGLIVEGKDEKEPLLKIRKIKALLNPVALLYKKISVLSLELEGIKIHASRNAGGRLSFQDILDRFNLPKATRKHLPETARKIPSQAGGETSPLAGGENLPATRIQELGSGQSEEASFKYDFIIRDLKISPLNVRFESAAVGSMLAFRANCDFSSIEMNKLRPNKPILVEMTGKCSKPGEIDISLSAKLDLKARRFELSSTFRPFDAMPFVRLFPSSGNVRLMSGVVGGKVKILVEPGEKVSWDSDLIAEDLAARLSSSGKSKWEQKKFARVWLKTSGSYDAAKNFARISEFEAKLPFLKLRLNQEALWNSGGRDRVAFDLNIEKLGLAAKWFTPVLGFSLKNAEDGGNLVLSLSASRIREKVGGLNVSASVKFSSIDVTPYMALVPHQSNLRHLRGRLGGSVEASYSAPGIANWKTSLHGDGISAQFRVKPRERWSKVKLASAEFLSEGSYDMLTGSGEFSMLDLKLPFGEARISKKGSWNISEIDEAEWAVTVSDIDAAARFASAVSGFPALKGKVAKGGKLDMKLAVSRSHRENAPIFLKGSASLKPTQMGPLVALVPGLARVQNLRVLIGGKVKFSLKQGEHVSWKMDLSGKKISGKMDFDGKYKRGRLALRSFQFGTDGWYNFPFESARVSRLDVKLPFGTMKLLKEARWNISGQDEAELAVKISDVGAVAQLTSAASGLSAKKGNLQKGGKVDVRLALFRSRKGRSLLSLKGSASLEPIQVEPFTTLLPESVRVKDFRGIMGGKASFSFKEGEEVSWRAKLSGKKIAGKVDIDRDKIWGVLDLKSIQLASAGRYSPRANSVRVTRLDAGFPFGSFKLLKEARWNLSDEDEFAVAWDLVDLGAAAKFAGAVAGGVVQSIVPLGRAKGSVNFSRDRKKSQTFAMKGSAKAVLERIHFMDYPNMEVQGEAGVKLEGNILNVSLPVLIVRERRRGQSPPLLDLREFKAAISPKIFMDGRFVSKKAAAGGLRINISMDSKKKSNLRRILTTSKKNGKEILREVKRSAKIPKRSRRPKGGKFQGKEVSTRNDGELSYLGSRVSYPHLDIRRISIGNLNFRFTHQVEAEGPPVVLEWKNLNFQARNLNTRMDSGRLDGEIEIVSRARPAPFSFQAKMNPALDPPELKGRLSLYRFDLSRLSPYALSTRGIKIQRGKIDLKSSFSLRGGHISSRISAKVRRLDLRQAQKKAILDKAQSVLQRLALKLLKRKNDIIPLNFKIEGRVDDPSFYTGRALTSVLLSGVISKLNSIPGRAGDIGEEVGDILKSVIEEIGDAISADKKGSSGVVPKRDAPLKGVPKKKDVLKEVERVGKEILRTLFGR